MTKKFTGKGLWLLSVFALALVMLPLTGGKAWADVITITENGIVYEVTKDDGEVKEVKVKGLDGFDGTELTIPPTVTKNDPVTDVTYNVTEIGDNAFKGSGLTSITLSEGLTKIGNSAFENNKQLTSITLPDGLKTIGNRAFLSCTNLQTVNLPNSLGTIGNSAFYGSGLTSITLPENVTSIGECVFQSCTSLTKVTLPKGLTTIPMCAFDGCKDLTEVNVPNTLESIDGHAFWGCSNLTSIELPDGLKKIGKKAFGDCANLTEIDLFNTNVTSIDSGTFNGCSQLASIKLPKGLTEIKDGVNYGDGSSDPGAFEGCTSLTSIDLPEGLTKIGDRAFFFCTSLETVNLPSSLETIGDSAFCGSGLTSITLPENVKSIGNNTFSACYSLHTADLEKSKITEIGDSVFTGCWNLQDVKLPNDLKHIRGSAFNASGLSSIVLPAGVQTIGCNAFMNTDLTSINLPAGLQSIDSQAFWNCRRLTEITLPAGLETIESQAFWGCTSLTEITLPEGLKTIGEKAFEDCQNLRVNITGNTLPGIGIGAFDDVKQVTCRNPKVLEQLEDYLGADTGKGFMVYKLDDMELADIPGQIHLDAAVEPEVTLLPQDETTFTVGEDYTLEYRDNTASGQGTVTITPTPTGKLYGDPVSKQFAIYQVTFNAGKGGTGTMEFLANYIVEGLKIKLPDCGFTAPKGMVFKAWQVGDTEYGLGDKIEITEDTIVTALWQDKPEDKPTPGDEDEEEPGDDKDPGTSDDDEKPGNGDEKPGTSDDEKEFWTIEIELNGGALPDLEGTTLKVPKDTDYTLPTPQRTGYTLEHWQIGQGGNTAAAGDVYRFSADTKIYAIWQENQNGSRPGGGHSRPTTPSQTTPEPTKPETSKPDPTKPDSTKPGSTQPAKTAADVFPDLVPGGWYMEAVNYVYGQGLMQGNPEGGFAPNANLTRAELAQILYNKEGKPKADGPSAFGDVAGGQWYTAAINWAAAKGIVLGYENNLFAPNDHITREQLAVMLWRYNGSPAVTRTQLPFKDAQEISSYALDAVCWAVEKGILKGYGDDLLKPGGFATRGEVAQMLFNLR